MPRRMDSRESAMLDYGSPFSCPVVDNQTDARDRLEGGGSIPATRFVSLIHSTGCHCPV